MFFIAIACSNIESSPATCSSRTLVPRARALRILEPHVPDVRAHDLALISRLIITMITGHRGQAGGCLVRMCVSLCLRFSDLNASLVCFFSCRRACKG